MRRVSTAALFAVYAAVVHFCGDYTPEGNITALVEGKVFGAILPAGSIWLKIGYYTWILPSMLFAAMTMCGLHSTEILRSGTDPRSRAVRLFGFGAAMLAAGLLAGVYVPVIKPIYTVSFTLQAMGWCVLSLDALYVLTDICGFRRFMSLPVLFGRHCLFAYMAMHVPFKQGFDAMANAVTAGAATHFGKGVQAFAAQIVVCASLVVALKVWAALKNRGKGS
jgi:predicted acyltransferase